jgi:hypothetical protein
MPLTSKAWVVEPVWVVVWAEERAVEEVWAVEEANELRKQIKPIEPGVRDLNKNK